jgi:hypothetical protein
MNRNVQERVKRGEGFLSATMAEVKAAKAKAAAVCVMLLPRSVHVHLNLV